MNTRDTLLAFQVLERASGAMLEVLREHRDDVELAVRVLAQSCPRYEQPSLFLRALEELIVVLEGAKREYRQHRIAAQTPSLWTPYQHVMQAPPSPMRSVRFLEPYRRYLEEQEALHQLYTRAAEESDEPF